MSFEQQMLQALQAFITEARDLLSGMEHSLLQLEGGADPDVVNELFRAAHTIKGSAGLFGLDGVVRFTHHLESLLDQMRAGAVAADDAVVGTLLDARDHLAGLIEAVAEGGDGMHPGSNEQALVARLQSLQAPSGLPQAPASASAEPRAQAAAGAVTVSTLSAADAETVVRLQPQEASTGSWHISLRFGRDCLRNGMDPLAFIRYLRGLGDIVGLATLDDGLPALPELDPESCYLGFEINFRSEASKADIEAVFEFVREDSDICILPAHSRIAEYVELIRSLPEDELRLGEILVQVGTLTRHELDHALREQEQGALSQPQGEREPLGQILVREGATHEPIVQAALDKQRQAKERRSREGQMLRVAADKLDALIDLVGELVIASAGNALHAQQPEQVEAAAQVTRLVEEIRERALKLRMVEIGETFARFQRVVRDTARELGKDIALVIQGGETEMDKSLVESITDPLMHLVRNSMDHGLEKPDVRIARGKPAQGTLRLSATHDAGSIVIEVVDDGAGLNRERICAKAVQRGLIAAEDAEAMPDAEVWKLIFEPGFSTAETITDLSGRGVGMDVVRRNIEAIRGSIEIHSEAGRGTTMHLRLPLTLAIIDGFLIESGGRNYVLPLDAVVECLQYPENAPQQGYLNLRGEVLPLLHLERALGTRAEGAPGAAGSRRNVVVVSASGQRVGLVVERLLGEYQTVIKPLGSLFAHLRGIGGSTILGNGRVALILDVPALLAAAPEVTRHHRALPGAQAA
ncbi:chemotaxis protein CheA [Thiomonas sp. FB-6]|uniref:chemotaxis protein CheA n=1 Tax=Thiomonas sp. FB-6 TaxID=1158291 RepID=UPI00036642D4|nr:chemotaxis protein CheA [Thiomonas sp. FB-6]